jgi:endonuclease/exonuclease/phosphatase family metal-dependent hydrolase
VRLSPLERLLLTLVLGGWLLGLGCVEEWQADGGWWTEDGLDGAGDPGGGEPDGRDGADDGGIDPLRIGAPDTFEIATWNLHNFPSDATSVERVAELLRRMDLDVVAVEEVADQAAFERLVDALPGFVAVLSPHQYSPGEYQKIGFLVRSSEVQVRAFATHFDGDGYAFPRPSLEVDLVAHPPGGSPRAFRAMGLHLKAGISEDDRLRRLDACRKLAARVDELLAAGPVSQVVLLGDFNDALDDPPSQNVFQAFLDEPERYVPLSAPPHVEGAFSYVPARAFIDHLIATASFLEGRAGPVRSLVVRLDQAALGYVYATSVSDHLPVVAILPW